MCNVSQCDITPVTPGTADITYLELSVLVVLELEWLSSSESDSRVLTDNFLGISFRAHPP